MWASESDNGIASKQGGFFIPSPYTPCPGHGDKKFAAMPLGMMGWAGRLEEQGSQLGSWWCVSPCSLCAKQTAHLRDSDASVLLQCA